MQDQELVYAVIKANTVRETEHRLNQEIALLTVQRNAAVVNVPGMALLCLQFGQFVT
jgi:hypothetical protein